MEPPFGLSVIDVLNILLTLMSELPDILVIPTLYEENRRTKQTESKAIIMLQQISW